MVAFREGSGAGDALSLDGRLKDTAELASMEGWKGSIGAFELALMTVCCCRWGLGLQRKAHSSGVRWRAFVTWKM